jgi:hypothetical protein
MVSHYKIDSKTKFEFFEELKRNCLSEKTGKTAVKTCGRNLRDFFYFHKLFKIIGKISLLL